LRPVVHTDEATILQNPRKTVGPAELPAHVVAGLGRYGERSSRLIVIAGVVEGAEADFAAAVRAAGETIADVPRAEAVVTWGVPAAVGGMAR
jgi:hypothetical protein